MNGNPFLNKAVTPYQPGGKSITFKIIADKNHPMEQDNPDAQVYIDKVTTATENTTSFDNCSVSGSDGVVFGYQYDGKSLRCTYFDTVK